MEAALEAAEQAGAIAHAYFGRRLALEAKADGTPVTEADRAAERAARAWIEARFPNDGILGEEHGGTRPDAQRRWLIDPIDGTKSFVRGVPLWGSMVAVVEADRGLAGAILFPALRERIAAAPGQGCWWNGARCSVSEVAEIARATVLISDEHFEAPSGRREGWRNLTGAAGLVRTWGDCYGYLLVATGRVEAIVDPVLFPWDAAPLIPIIEEAGGVFSDWEGRRSYTTGSAIATNAALADEARRLLGCPAVAARG
jgi:histidinol phosphatase-like enzyme (inositol monophosphatase family)